MKNNLPVTNNYNKRNRPAKFSIKGTLLVQCLAVVLLLLNLILLYCIFSSSQGIPGFRQQYRQVQELQSKIKKLKQENQKLFNQIQSFKSDPQAQERLVRQQLGWGRDNELVIEFLHPKKEGSE